MGLLLDSHDYTQVWTRALWCESAHASFTALQCFPFFSSRLPTVARFWNPHCIEFTLPQELESYSSLDCCCLAFFLFSLHESFHETLRGWDLDLHFRGLHSDGAGSINGTIPWSELDKLAVAGFRVLAATRAGVKEAVSTDMACLGQRNFQDESHHSILALARS